MSKKWILVHVMSGIAETVELFDSLKEARIAEERNSRQANLDNEDFSIFSIDIGVSNKSIQKVQRFDCS